MEITIEEAIEKLKTDEYESEEYVCAIDLARYIMRKYKKIQEIVKKWELDSWTDNLSYESMIQIREVLEDGNENNHYASNS